MAIKRDLTATKAFLSFFAGRYRTFLVGAASLFVIAMIITLVFTEIRPTTLSITAVEAVDLAIGFATVLIAGLVFIGEAREQWIAQLPLRLSVYYIEACASRDGSVSPRIRMVV